MDSGLTSCVPILCFKTCDLKYNFHDNSLLVTWSWLGPWQPEQNYWVVIVATGCKGIPYKSLTIVITGSIGIHDIVAAFPLTVHSVCRPYQLHAHDNREHSGPPESCPTKLPRSLEFPPQHIGGGDARTLPRGHLEVYQDRECLVQKCQTMCQVSRVLHRFYLISYK